MTKQMEKWYSLLTDYFIALLTLLSTEKPCTSKCCLTKCRKTASTHPQNGLYRLHGIGDCSSNCLGYCTNDEHIQRRKLESKKRANHINPNNRVSEIIICCSQNQGLPLLVSLEAAVLNLHRTWTGWQDWRPTARKEMCHSITPRFLHLEWSGEKHLSKKSRTFDYNSLTGEHNVNFVQMYPKHKS